MQISHLFAGKPQAFGSRGAPSSIIKKPYKSLIIKFDGAVEDEQGNKKLHGGPFMALHQYAQSSFDVLAAQFTNTQLAFDVGSIGENLSAPSMDDETVFIGDTYEVGSAILQLVSPRAPCSKINTRFGISRVDAFIYEKNITGWYYSVLKEGEIACGDSLKLVDRPEDALSVSQIWQLRKCIKQLPAEAMREYWLNIADTAINTPSLAPEWQAFANRAAVKLSQ